MTPKLTDLGFATCYEATVLPGLPGTGVPPLQIHASHQRSHREGLVVEVRGTDGGRWTGNVQPGDGKLSGLYPTPSPDCLCVIAGGRGYLVPVREPATYEMVGAYPIEDVRSIPELGLLLFVTFTDVVAYDAKGRVWSAGRVSWDGISIRSVSSEGVHGTAWDSPEEREVGFFIDPRTGAVEGGAAPPDY
jgi:hypothetical protein